MRNRRSGTTLVELLVVIVIFMVGILAILQVFPGGLRILQETRGMQQARALARAQVEMTNSRSDILAEMILPVHYTFVGSGFVDIVAFMGQGPGYVGHSGDEIDSDGNVILAGINLGRWDYLTGANRTRRVIGEGGPVPAPRQIGADFGGLMLLQFAPISYDPAYPTLLQIYGNDMVRREGEPWFRVREWEYWVEDPEETFAQIHLPRHTVRARSYRLAFSAWISNGVTVTRRSIVDSTVNVPANPSGGYATFPLSAYAALQPGETFVGAEFESIRVARAFELVAAFTPNEPYEYRLLDAQLGVILCNPAGYNFQEVRPGRRLPLVAKANYDVFDWRIIRDEFRVASTLPLQQKLQLNNLKVKLGQSVDGRRYYGLDCEVLPGPTPAPTDPQEPPRRDPNKERRDFILLDLETGGVYTMDSFGIDKSTGLISYRDTDTGSPGLQMQLNLPGPPAPPVQVDATGRAVRALYQANGEWAVQVMKAPSLFTITYSAPGVAQYYVGASSVAGGSPTRIYFPVIDLGRTVVIGEIWYQDGGGAVHSLKDQDFVIQNSPADPLGPYIDITSIDPTAVAFNYNLGYAVRRVKGASVAVRVLWNPNSFSLGADPQDNNVRFARWTQTWKRTLVETFLAKGEN